MMHTVWAFSPRGGERLPISVSPIRSILLREPSANLSPPSVDLLPEIRTCCTTSSTAPARCCSAPACRPKTSRLCWRRWISSKTSLSMSSVSGITGPTSSRGLRAWATTSGTARRPLSRSSSTMKFELSCSGVLSLTKVSIPILSYRQACRRICRCCAPAIWRPTRASSLTVHWRFSTKWGTEWAYFSREITSETIEPQVTLWLLIYQERKPPPEISQRPFAKSFLVCPIADPALAVLRPALSERNLHAEAVPGYVPTPRQTNPLPYGLGTAPGRPDPE